MPGQSTKGEEAVARELHAERLPGPRTFFFLYLQTASYVALLRAHIAGLFLVERLTITIFPLIRAVNLPN